MSTAAVDRYDLHAATTLAPPLALAGLTTFLFVRLLPDVADKPLHEDEAVAGLISARPLGDCLHTVVLVRGGALVHVWLGHLARATRRSSVRDHPVRGGGGGCDLALERSRVSCCPSGCWPRTACGSVVARGPPPLGTLRTGSRPADGRRKVGDWCDVACSR